MSKFDNYIHRFSTSKAVFYLVVIYTVGLLLSSFVLTQPIFQFLIPINILFAVFVLYLFHQGEKKKLLLAFFSVAVLSFFVEGLGVNTGKIFGNYTYQTALGYKWWNTPIMIGVNWFLLVYCTQIIARKWTNNKVLVVFIAASLMLMYDFVLEPIAIHFRFWNWQETNIPLQNYGAWFVLACLFHTLMVGLKFYPQNRLAAAIFYIQFVFFILLHFIHAIPFLV